MNLVYLVWMNISVFYTLCFLSSIKRLCTTDHSELVFTGCDAKWFMHLYGEIRFLQHRFFNF